MSNETKIQQLREQINTLRNWAKSITVESEADRKLQWMYFDTAMDKAIELVALGGKL